MHCTGMRPAQMVRLEPDEFRSRGNGGRLAAIRVTGERLDGVREFMAASASGRWFCASAKKARERGGLRFNVYQIRQAFATGLRRAGSNGADIQDLYGHTDP